MNKYTHGICISCGNYNPFSNFKGFGYCDSCLNKKLGVDLVGMDNEKLNAIRERVNKYKESLTGHWSETDQQMLHDLLKGYEELNNRKMFFRTITLNKWSESVPGFYIETVEVKNYKNGDGEIEIRVKFDGPMKRNVIRVPMLENGDCELNKVFTLVNNITANQMIKIANEVLA